MKRSISNCNSWPEYLTYGLDYQSVRYTNLCQPVKAMPSNFMEGYLDMDFMTLSQAR